MITKIRYRKDGKTVKWVRYYPEKSEYVGTWPFRPYEYGIVRSDMPVTITATDNGAPFTWDFTQE